MSRWANIENGEIAGIYYHLPDNWKNITGFKFLENDLDKLKELGWLPIEEEIVDYNNTTQVIEKFNYNLVGEKVIGTPVIVDRISPLLPSQEQLDQQYLQSVREERDIKLKDSDWTQLADIQNNKSPEWILQWVNYRQLLRDLPATYISGSLTIQWPQKPPTN